MVKHFTRFSCYIVIVLSVLVIAATVWLGQGPRSMNWARGWLTSALNPQGAPYSISIGDVYINWQNFTEFGDLHVKNMQVAQADGSIFAVLPDVRITLDPIGFMPHHRVLHGIKVDAPRLFMTRDEQGILRFGLDGVVEKSLPVSEFLAFFASDDTATSNTRGSLPFREFSLQNASLRFTDSASGAKLLGKPFSFRIRRIGDDLSGSLAVPFIYKDKPGSIDASLTTKRIDRQRVLNVLVEQLPAELVCMAANCPANQQFEGNVSGKLTAQLDFAESVKEVALAAHTEKATFTAPNWFPEPMKIKNAGIIATAYDNFTRVDVQELILATKDTKITLKGTATKKEDGWHAKGEGANNKLNIAKLANYWPIPLAQDSRTWVISHITSGYSDSATIKFDVLPIDITSDSIRDESMLALVNARDLTVDYLPGFPKLTGVGGPVTFTGKKITADVQSGTMLSGTQLKPSVITFTNLDIPATPTETTINLTAPAKDVATLLQHKIFTFDDPLKLNPDTISGDVDATLKLAFDAFSNPDAPPDAINLAAVKYDITTTLNNVSQPQLMGRDISGLSGTLTANDAGVKFDGALKVDDTNLAMTFSDDSAGTVATAKGTLTRKQFTALGIPDVKQLGEGSIGVDAAVSIHKDNTELKRAELDLTNIALTVPEISWSKPAGGAASLSLTPASGAQSYNLAIAAPDLTVTGATLTLTPAMDDLQSLKLGRVKTSKNDFSLTYATTADGFDVNLSGSKLDNSDSFMQPDDSPEDSLLAKFPPVNLTIDLGELTLVPNLPLQKLKGHLTCNRTRCPSADISAKTGAGILRASIGKTEGARQLLISSDNAGDTLRALDISDRMYGGTLDLRGSYADALNPPPLNGRIQINSFKLKNSEILARILSVGSLSGMLNLLTGQGIDFEKIAMNFSHLNGVVDISKGRAESNALGITVEGRVDMSRDKLKLKGAVIPANLFNSFLGKIPIIGQIAGGDEGLIAFNYSVSGKMRDPQVSVNPLSGLTPGFLRGIWSGSPSGESDDSASDSKEKKPAYPQ
jgi:hypothetical protein